VAGNRFRCMVCGGYLCKTPKDIRAVGRETRYSYKCRKCYHVREIIEKDGQLRGATL